MLTNIFPEKRIGNNWPAKRAYQSRDMKSRNKYEINK